MIYGSNVSDRRSLDNKVKYIIPDIATFRKQPTQQKGREENIKYS